MAQSVQNRPHNANSLHSVHHTLHATRLLVSVKSLPITSLQIFMNITHFLVSIGAAIIAIFPEKLCMDFLFSTSAQCLI